MLVINSIDKARLSGDTYSYSGNGVAWKARLVLFLGFALMAGGLAGAVVCACPMGSILAWNTRLTQRADRDGAEVCGTRIRLSDPVVRCRERGCKHFDNDFVS